MSRAPLADEVEQVMVQVEQFAAQVGDANPGAAEQLESAARCLREAAAQLDRPDE